MHKKAYWRPRASCILTALKKTHVAPETEIAD